MPLSDRAYGTILGSSVSALSAGTLGPVAAWSLDTAAQVPGIMALPQSERYARWLPALGQASHLWMADRAYDPWNAWMQVAHDPAVALSLAGATVVLGLVVGVVTAHPKNPFSRWGGPHATGKGEHGSAHWRPMHGPQGLTGPKGYAVWRPPQVLRRPKHQQALPPPSGQVLGPIDGRPVATPSAVAERIAAEYYQERHRQQSANQPSGLVIGLVGDRPQRGAYVVAGDEHSLVIGLTGAGKSRRLYLPTIGVIGTGRRESLIVADVKGELYQHTAGWLRSQGYAVRRIDLRQHPNADSTRFNPLAPIQAALERGDWSVATAMARSVAQMLVRGSNAQPKDPFWERAEIGLIVALILAHAEYAAPEQNTLYSVYSSLSLPFEVLDAWFTDRKRYPPGHPTALAYSAVHSAGDAPETLGGILTGAQGALELFGLTEIAHLTSAQDGDPAEAGQALTATFLVVPWQDDSRYPIVSLYLAQTIQALATAAEQNRARPGKLAMPVHFLLDEFGNFPAIPGFATIITTARSAGMRFTMAVQSPEQIEEKYEKGGQTILENARTWVFLATNGHKTADLISQMCGEYTLEQSGMTLPKTSFWSSAAVASASENTQLHGRRLVTPDEVRRWPLIESLVLQAGFAPARLPLPDLSAWHTIFPAIQRPMPDPDPAPPRPYPPIWPLAALVDAKAGSAAALSKVAASPGSSSGIDVLFTEV